MIHARTLTSPQLFHLHGLFQHSLHVYPRPFPVGSGTLLPFAEEPACCPGLREVTLAGRLESGAVLGVEKLSLVCFMPCVWFSFQVDNLLLVVMESAHLVLQRKAFQQSIEGLMTVRHEQTSSQPVIAKGLQQLKVLTTPSLPLDGKLWKCHVV